MGAFADVASTEVVRAAEAAAGLADDAGAETYDDSAESPCAAVGHANAGFAATDDADALVTNDLVGEENGSAQT